MRITLCFILFLFLFFISWLYVHQMLSLSCRRLAEHCIYLRSTYLGLHLHDREFRCCLGYWLRVPLHSISYSCPEYRSTANLFSDHQVGCGGNGDQISRHNAIRDVLFFAAQFAALAPSKEILGLISSSLSRPADILELWLPGCC